MTLRHMLIFFFFFFFYNFFKSFSRCLSCLV